MKAAAHLCASAAAGGAAYGLTGSAETGLACLVSGVLLDLDHLADFCLLSGERFTLKGFLDWCHEVKWTRIWLLLHSYELFALLALAACFFRSGALDGILLGMGLHLLMDQLGNRALHKWFYFLAFRWRSGFRVEVLAPKRGRRERGRRP